MEVKKWLETIKTQVLDHWDQLADWVDREPKRAMLTGASLLACSLLFTGGMLWSQRHIRQSEYENLVFSALPSKKIQPLSYQSGDHQISKAQAISVMFSKPQGKTYQQVLDLLGSEKAQEFNRQVFYYPIVYNTAGIQEKYGVNPNQVTIVFFEKGKEKNRFVVEQLTDFGEEFIPELNRLPMWSIKEIEEK